LLFIFLPSTVYLPLPASNTTPPPPNSIGESNYKDSGCGTIKLKQIDFPARPPTGSFVRATVYEQMIVTRQRTDGAEWMLMFVQETGLRLPGSLKTWAAQKGFPMFYRQCLEAVKEYGKRIDAQ
jgi:hypothetical protein